MSATSAISNSTQGSQHASTTKQLKTDDFINMMLTQLQNQDPLNPASNADLMAQMAQIGQLQNNSQLQELLTSLASQSQIGSAGNLIGKTVQGLDDNNDKVQGLVTSVQIAGNKISLELDSGKVLALDNVTYIAPGPTASGTSVAN
jgi:flagellar basal-body rod modification protein FlgD